LSELLGQSVVKCDDSIGDAVARRSTASTMARWPYWRTCASTPKKKPTTRFCQKLAANADLYVNDAFGTAHRAHASTEGVTKYLSPSVAAT
jgi:phosphoglycerate kinase